MSSTVVATSVGLLGAIHHQLVSVPRAARVASALGTLVADHGGAERLLDVGSGDGAIAARVAAALGAEIHGVDVRLQPSAHIAVTRYDGQRLPFDDGSYDVVMLSDVLHHARDPERLLRECLRVARRGVAIKDHLRFGATSQAVLWLMDVVGNQGSGVEVTGRYFTREQWVDLARRAGGRIASLRWPLRIHDLPWRMVTRSELQFAAFVEHAHG